MTTLRHLVLLRFKPAAAAADIAAVEAAFCGLPAQIGQIRDFEWGTDVSPEGLSKGYTHAFALGFDSAADRDAYLPHPAHQAFVARLQPLLDDALVVDYHAAAAAVAAAAVPAAAVPASVAAGAGPVDDLARIAEQERRLCIAEPLTAAFAWRLGTQLKALAEARGAALTIEVRLHRETVFFHAMSGTTPANADWARRKRNAVELLGQSSYRIGLALGRDAGGASSLEQKMGLPTRDYASHGGAFPLRTAAGGAVAGSVVVSGLPQREDHALVVEVLAALCGVPLHEVALAAG